MVDGTWWLGHGGGSKGLRNQEFALARQDTAATCSGKVTHLSHSAHKRYLVARAANGMITAPRLYSAADWRVGLELGTGAADAMRWLVLVWVDAANMCVCVGEGERYGIVFSVRMTSGLYQQLRGNCSKRKSIYHDLLMTRDDRTGSCA